jgi:type II secretory pathway predicted ATPase ExeA
MNENYRNFFGFQKEPFRADLSQKEILLTDPLLAVKSRFDYALRLGGIILVTGEIGSGKSTALRYAACCLHPSEYQVFNIIATSGSILELFRQIASEAGVCRITNSKATITALIRNEIRNLALGKKIHPVVVIDEASLLRLEVLAELHTICQFDGDSKPMLPIILAGQSSLVDKLMFRSSAPLSSRIIARCHLEGLNIEAMGNYLIHHVNLAGITTNLFDEAATIAIHQGSGGLLRKANHLARGALIAAAKAKSIHVTAEHVRLAATELF